MRTTTTIDGRRVRLRPATLADRRMIHPWSYASDVAPLLHLSDPPTRPLADWCDDWEEHYFTDGEPERGRGLGRSGPSRQRAHDPGGAARLMTPSLWVDSGAGGGSA